MIDASSSANHAATRQNAFSLRDLLLLVTGCGLFCGIVVQAWPDERGLLLTWGTLILGQTFWAYHVFRRLNLLSDAEQQDARQVRSRRAFHTAWIASAVPCTMWLLVGISELSGPGAVTEAIEFWMGVLVFVFAPVALLALVASVVVLVRGRLDLGILITQIASTCTLAWPFVYIPFFMS